MTNKKVAVLVIHGMGAQRVNYANKMIKELNNRVKNDHKKNPARIAWKSIHWADVLQEAQLKYLDKAKKSARLDFIALRKFVVTYLGDAVAYQKGSPKYKAIHKEIQQSINELYATLGRPSEYKLSKKDSPKLIVLAHSLGGHIMSNYIWDLQEGLGFPKEDNSFERMEKLVRMVTFGCNIPLFALANAKKNNLNLSKYAIKFEGEWLNFYDRDDILGYPLEPIYSKLTKPKLKDMAINVGGIFTSWNPMCHNDYWTDNDFTKPVSKLIAKYC